MGIEERELSSDEVLYWQNRLEQRKKTFAEAREFLKKHTLTDLSPEEAGEVSKIHLHPVDLITPAQDTETLSSLLEKNLRVIQEIQDALERLDRGVFGICQSCSEPIPRNRLEAIPEVRYCLNCQSDLEEMRRVSKSSSSIKSLGSTLVSDVMQKKPVSIRLNQGLDVATQLMSQHNIRHLPVVDDHGDIQGIISDRDLISVVFDASWTNVQEFENFWSKKIVSSITIKNPKSVKPNTPLKEAGTILLDNKISCLPVLEGRHLVGIITDTDFVKLICK